MILVRKTCDNSVLLGFRRSPTVVSAEYLMFNKAMLLHCVKFEFLLSYLILELTTHYNNMKAFYIVSLGSSTNIFVEYLMLNMSIRFQSFTVEVLRVFVEGNFSFIKIT